MEPAARASGRGELGRTLNGPSPTLRQMARDTLGFSEFREPLCQLACLAQREFCVADFSPEVFFYRRPRMDDRKLDVAVDFLDEYLSSVGKPK